LFQANYHINSHIVKIFMRQTCFSQSCYVVWARDL